MNVGALLPKDYGWTARTSRVGECLAQIFPEERPSALAQDASLSSPEAST